MADEPPGLAEPALQDEIARVMEAPRALLPELPYLLRDLPSLSGSTDEVLALLRRGGFPRGGSVLDLGCGRGDISLAVAREFAARVTGIDAFEPFIDQARKAAAAAGLAERCTFHVGDLRSAVYGFETANTEAFTPLPSRERSRGGRRSGEGEDFIGSKTHDAVLLIAVGPVLGGPAATVGALRRVVRTGGLMIIDDAYRAGADELPPEWDDYLDLAATEAALTRHGDRIETCLDATEGMDDFNDRALEVIQQRAAALSARRPGLTALLDEYVERQKREVELLRGPVVPSVWAVRKNNR